MYYLILQVFLFGNTYARNCTISTDTCPKGEIKWKQRAEEFNCTNKYGKYTCMKDFENSLVETCVDNIVIKKGVVGCPFIVICRDNTALIGLDEDFSYCPTNHSGCPPQHHTGYALHEIYKYPACSSNFDSLVSGNEGTFPDESEEIPLISVVVPVISIVAVLCVGLGIIFCLRRKNFLRQFCEHGTDSDDMELGTRNSLLGDEDASEREPILKEICCQEKGEDIDQELIFQQEEPKALKYENTE